MDLHIHLVLEDEIEEFPAVGLVFLAGGHVVEECWAEEL